MEGRSTVEDRRPRNSYHRVCYVFSARAASTCHWSWTAVGDVGLCHGAADLGYRHTGCLQLSYVQTADPSADGHRSAVSQTAIGGGNGGISFRILGAITCCCCQLSVLPYTEREMSRNASVCRILCKIDRLAQN